MPEKSSLSTDRRLMLRMCRRLRELDRRSISVLIILVIFSDEKGASRPGAGTIEDFLGVDAHYVARGIKRLRELGLLRRSNMEPSGSRVFYLQPDNRRLRPVLDRRIAKLPIKEALKIVMD